MEMILNLYLALIMTLIIELGMALILKVRDKLDLLYIALINCITNPILNIILVLIVSFFVKNNIVFYIIVIIFEIIVVFVEYLFYKNRLKYNRISLLLFSFILNASSFGLGLIYNYLF